MFSDEMNIIELDGSYSNEEILKLSEEIGVKKEDLLIYTGPTDNLFIPEEENL